MAWRSQNWSDCLYWGWRVECRQSLGLRVEQVLSSGVGSMWWQRGRVGRWLCGPDLSRQALEGAMKKRDGSLSSFPLRFGGVRKSLSTAGPSGRQLSERLGRYCHPANSVVSLHLVFSWTLSRYKHSPQRPPDRLPQNSPGTNLPKRVGETILFLVWWTSPYRCQSRTQCYDSLGQDDVAGWGSSLWAWGGANTWEALFGQDQQLRAVMVHLLCKAHTPHPVRPQSRRACLGGAWLPSSSITWLWLVAGGGG